MTKVLNRFLEAQERAYDGALAELVEGRKRGHWIWYVLPQRKGLGSSHYSVLYGLEDEKEATEYLAHPVLGPRYEDCIKAIHGWVVLKGLSPRKLMGSDLDALKLASSVEIFSRVAPAGSALATLLAELSQALPPHR